MEYKKFEEAIANGSIIEHLCSRSSNGWCELVPEDLRRWDVRSLRIKPEDEQSLVQEKDVFINAKVGDRVWDMKYGWGFISSNNHTFRTPLYVKFDGGHDKHYTLEGYLIGNSWEKYSIPTLFWSKFEIPKEAYIKPLPLLIVDTRVRVWDKNKGKKLNRHFRSFDEEGRVTTFLCGADSWGADDVNEFASWDNWELVEDNEGESDEW